MGLRRKITLFALVAVSLVGEGLGVVIPTVTWGPTTASPWNLFSGTSWVGGVAPSSTQTGVFGPSSATSVFLPAAGTIGGLQFSSTSPSYIFSSAGSVLAVGSSGITTASAANQYFNIPLTFSAVSTSIRNDGGGSLQLSGLTMGTGASLSFDGNGKGGMVVQGAISGSGSVTKTGSGSLLLASGNNIYAGGTFITQGALIVNTNQAIPTGTSVTVNANGGSAMLQLNGTTQSLSQLNLGGTATTGRSVNSVDLGGTNGLIMIGGSGAGSINYLASSSAATDPSMGMIKGGSIDMMNGGSINVANSSNAVIDLSIDSSLKGSSGTVTKTGAGTLLLSGSGSSLYANLVASSGTLLLGPAFAASTSGTGVIEVQSGATLAGSTYSATGTTSSYTTDIGVTRSVILRNGAQLGSSVLSQGKLVFNGPVTVDAGATIKIGGYGGVQIAGGIDASSSAGTITVANADATRRSVLGITSALGSNLTSLTSAGAAVVFSVTPTATSLLATSGGYIGIAPSTSSGVAPSVAAMTNLVGASKGLFTGTFGFDSPKSYSGLIPQTYSEALDFSGFNTAMTLGSVTGSILTGTITPADPSKYSFGNGGGVLVVTSGLTDGASASRGLSVVSATATPDNGLGLVLQGTNSFSGNVTVDNSYLLLDSFSAFPAKPGQQIQLTTASGAYLGTTEVSNVASFRRLGTFLGSNYSPLSVIGFDSHDYLNAMIYGTTSTATERVVVEGLNLSSYAPFYFGTVTRATLAGTLVAPASGVSAGNRALYLAAMNDGRLTVRSPLSSASTDKLVIGGTSPLGMDGTVVMSGRNTFSGGTTLLSGKLEIGSGTRFSAGSLSAGPLGTGVLSVPANASGPSLQGASFATGYVPSVTLANNIALDSRLVLGDTKYSSGNAGLNLSGVISGAGGLDIFGQASLGAANTFTGGVQFYSGNLTLANNGALGTGDLFISPNGSVVLAVDGNREITNNVTLAVPSSYASPIVVNGKGSLNLKGTVTLQTDTVFSPQTYPLKLSGSVTGTGSITNTGYAALILSGTTTYAGNTYSSGGPIIFSALTYQSGNPSGMFQSYTGGYIGVASTAFGTGGTFQNTFIDRFDKGLTAGSLGFDSLPDSGGNLTVNTFSGPVDLTGFTSNVRLGSATQAILSGTITPQGNVYRFGSGGGTLTVTSTLTDLSGTNVTARSLDVVSPTNLPLTLRLAGGGNTFSGGVTVSNSGVVFGAATGSLPATGNFTVSNFGYFGTEDATLYNSNLSSYLSRFVVGSGGAVIGFDLAGTGTPTAVTGAIDLSRVTIDPNAVTNGKSPWVYLGTASKAELGTGATITLPANQGAFAFSAYKGGELTVSTALTGTFGVKIGDNSNAASMGNPANPSAPLSTVILQGNNSYSGETLLTAGQLLVGSNSALGTGTLRVSGFSGYSPSLPYYPVLAATAAGSGQQWQIANPVVLEGSLTLGGSNPFTLAGVISGSGAYLYKTGPAAVTLSGANTFGGGIEIDQGTIIFAHGQATGTGVLTLSGTGSPVAQFTQSLSSLQGLSGSAVGGVVQMASNATLVVTQPMSAEYAGAFAGSSTLLRFQGPGYDTPTLVLSGSSPSFSGTTSIDSGIKLQIANAGALGNSAVAINGGKLVLERDVRFSNPVAFDSANGGALGGNGELVRASTLTVGAHAGLDPGGDLPGVLSFSAASGFSGALLNLATGGTLKIKMSDALDPLGGWDRINVAGLTTFDVPNGLFTIKLSFVGSATTAAFANFDATQNYAWPIIVTGFPISGFSPNSIAVDLGGAVVPSGGSFFASLNQAGDTVLLNYSPVAVPEPSTWALMLSGAAFLGFKLRRRRF